MAQVLMLKYIFSTFISLWMLMNSSCSWAKVRYWPTGVQLSMDVSRPLYYKFYEENGVHYEFNSSIDFSRLMLEGDYGWGKVEQAGLNHKTNTASVYTNHGKYFRVGLNYNFVKDTPDKNAAFLGLRYARGFFKDALKSRVNYALEGLVENGPLLDMQQDKVQARWFEAVSGVKVKVWKLLYVGCTMRYKFGLKITHTTAHLPFEILGWGLNDEEAFGFNYYISLRIPLVRTTSLMRGAEESKVTSAPIN